MQKLRVIVSSLAILGIAALLVWGRWSSRESVTSKPLPFSNADCGRCHARVFQEWQTSYHSRSWSDPQIVAAFRHFGHDRKCESCHAPEPILIEGTDRPTLLRAANRESGVDCLSCHARSDGQIAARHTHADAPCRPRETPALLDSQHCGVCHTAIFKDWNESRYRSSGRGCVACHFPPLHPDSSERSHVCLGGHDAPTIRSGATMECTQVGDQVVVRVTNDNTGHNFPGERHNRILLVEVTERSEAGEITLARQTVIKHVTPFRGESSAERLKIDEIFQTEYPVEPGSVVAHIQLLHKSFPFQSDREAVVVHELQLGVTPP